MHASILDGRATWTSGWLVESRVECDAARWTALALGTTRSHPGHDSGLPSRMSGTDLKSSDTVVLFGARLHVRRSTASDTAGHQCGGSPPWMDPKMIRLFHVRGLPP